MGIDPAYGSSAFGIVVTQWEEDNHIQILHVNYQFYSSNVSITFYGKGIGKRKGIEFFVFEIEGS
jgi:hypothetical protein